MPGQNGDDEVDDEVMDPRGPGLSGDDQLGNRHQPELGVRPEHLLTVDDQFGNEELDVG